MSKSDEYQRRAEECQRMANTAPSDREKRSWLDMAESWLRMVVARKKPSQSAGDAFDAEAEEKGTGQKQSDTSN